jgi:hypothetical protein
MRLIRVVSRSRALPGMVGRPPRDARLQTGRIVAPVVVWTVAATGCFSWSPRPPTVVASVAATRVVAPVVAPVVAAYGRFRMVASLGSVTPVGAVAGQLAQATNRAGRMLPRLPLLKRGVSAVRIAGVVVARPTTAVPQAAWSPAWRSWSLPRRTGSAAGLVGRPRDPDWSDAWSCDLPSEDHAYRNVSPGRRRLVGCSHRRYWRLISRASRLSGACSSPVRY